jgi:hypothetical protein
MFNQINELIETNLNLLVAAYKNMLHCKDFKDNCGNKLKNAKILADIMVQKELIILVQNEEFIYEITEFGKHISENGGWLEYLSKLKEIEIQIRIQQSQNKLIRSKPNHQKWYFLSYILTYFKSFNQFF